MGDVVNTGSSDNDGSGDKLRGAFQRINVRFQELLGTINGRGAWATGVVYNATPARDWVIQGGQAYAAVTNHTSGVFATDLAAGRWLAVDVLQLINDLAASGGSSLVGFTQPGAGADLQTLQSKLRQRYTLADYFDPGEGSAAMHNALTRVCNEAPRQTVEIDIGDFDWTLNSDFVLPAAKRVVMHGHGAINFAGGSIVRNVHDKHTILHGFKASGAYSVFRFAAAPSGSAYREYEISGIETSMNSGVWAIQLNGAREGEISNCYFRSGRGILSALSNIRHITKSHFLGNEFAIYDAGTGSGFDIGSQLLHTEILGCNRSWVISRCDDAGMIECTVDYNDEGIQILGQDRLKIFGGYIGTRAAEAATPNVALGAIGPAIRITSDAGSRSEKITLVGAILTGHDDTNQGYSCMLVDECDRLTIADSTLSFYTQNAVRWGANVTYMNVHNCQTANKGGSPATNVFECTSTDSNTNRVTANVINPGQGIVAPLARISRNVGFATRNSGEVVAISGVTSVVVNHGLAVTPLKSDVSLSPTNNAAALLNPFVSTITATQITIGFTSTTVANSGVAWSVNVDRF